METEQEHCPNSSTIESLLNQVEQNTNEMLRIAEEIDPQHHTIDSRDFGDVELQPMRAFEPEPDPIGNVELHHSMMNATPPTYIPFGRDFWFSGDKFHYERLATYDPESHSASPYEFYNDPDQDPALQARKTSCQKKMRLFSLCSICFVVGFVGFTATLLF
jgi:hypothetical protein